MILYEYPFNERVRTCLRLERLLDRLHALVAREDAIDHQFAIYTLFELLEVTSRSDLKAELLRELERQRHMLQAFQGNPAVDEAALAPMLRQAENTYRDLQQLHGRIGGNLLEDELLNMVRSRAHIPGGTCEFDLPAYHAWLHSPSAQRQRTLQQWCQPLQSVYDAVQLLLSLLRNGGHTQKVHAQSGVFQQSLPNNRSYQLLQLRLDETRQVVPEISGNHLLISVRFMREDSTRKLQPHAIDLPFELTLCA